MHILFDLRTRALLPRAAGIYLAALADNFLPALASEDSVTILSAQGAELPFEPIAQHAVTYCQGKHDARSHAGARELAAIAARQGVDVYLSADPLVRPPPGVQTLFAISEVRHFLEPRAFGWCERLRWRFEARPRLLAAQAVLCPSHALEVRLIAHAGWQLRRRTRVIESGVEPSFRVVSEETVLAVRRRWLVPRRYVLMVETVGAAANLEVPLRALAQNEEVSAVTCVIVGRRTLPGLMRERVRACHLEGMVRYLPVDELPDADLAALMTGAAAVFEPTRETDFRPTIAQALACGAPVICSAGATNQELFGNAVLRVHPTDPAEWAKAFSAVTLSLALRERLRERGLQCMAERTWTATAKAVFALAREVAATRKGAHA